MFLRNRSAERKAILVNAAACILAATLYSGRAQTSKEVKAVTPLCSGEVG